MRKLPGTRVPGTPSTDSVEYAYVSTANATASELIVSACRLSLANLLKLWRHHSTPIPA